VIKELLAKIIGKKISEKLDLTEGTPMENGKPWYKSKSVLTGIVTVIVGTYEAVAISLAPQMGWSLPAIPPLIFTLLGALGIYTRVVANTTITK
jgi:hypothetical protein